jgi:DNA polymerase
MSDDRASGATFAPDDICWIDFETRSGTDIAAGSYRYATEADAIVLAYAIGDGEVKTVSVTGFDGQTLVWEKDAPIELKTHFERASRGEAIFAAWNAGFDRAIWNYATVGFPEMEPFHIIDVMAQATAAGLPPDLDMASKVSRWAKHDTGAHLVALFCTPKGYKGVLGTPQSHPAEWQAFLDYARGDIEAMRSVFKHTKQLTLAEWREYWAMEAINARGVAIDMAMVAAAAKLAAEDKIRSREALARLTGGCVTTVDQVARITSWLLPQLPSAGIKELTKREEEIDAETGKSTKPAKLALTRKRIERLIALCERGNTADYRTDYRAILSVLQIRKYGGSKTPAKFVRMLEQQVDGVLYGQYVFNGASQTGRASSRGVQIHNLARDTLPYEREAIDAIGNIKYDELMLLGDDSPVARKLSLLIRPCFVPQGDNVFVWSDWSQIEARIVPWLCDHHEGARARLQLFRDVDADPSLPDLYTRTAADVSHIPVEQVTKPIRQRGKVAELALGFLGGVPALQNMAAGYGLHLTDEEAKVMVDRWRKANPWAQQFGNELWDAAHRAMGSPGQPHRAGRIWFRYQAEYLGGSLLCRLPSGRCLTYRDIRYQTVDVLDEDDKPTGKKRSELTFARGYGRVKAWPGLFVENFTQGTAADCLRGTLVRLVERNAPVRLHTHDEILLEVPKAEAAKTIVVLGILMRKGFDWSKGLPLMSEETIAYYYTKHEGSHGL